MKMTSLPKFNLPNEGKRFSKTGEVFLRNKRRGESGLSGGHTPAKRCHRRANGGVAVACVRPRNSLRGVRR